MCSKPSAHFPEGRCWLDTGVKTPSPTESADQTGRRICDTSAIITSLTSIWWHLFTAFLEITVTEVIKKLDNDIFASETS